LVSLLGVMVLRNCWFFSDHTIAHCSKKKVKGLSQVTSTKKVLLMLVNISRMILPWKS